MDSLELLEGVAEELDAFEREEERPVWPDTPTSCPISECSSGPLYSSHLSFMRHWTSKHKPFITIYKCPNCNRQFGRRDNVKNHQRKQHKMEGGVNEMSISNKHYVDPKCTQPYRPRHKERLAAKRRAQSTEGNILVTAGDGVCRDEEAVLVGDHVIGKKFKHK